ncbi:MAG: putative sulfate exporter family transporter, partial [Muribaculaceae bacterium]|nr:putative sulfate exporter family transporter [Muribaculaceae bacterium]
MKQFSLFVYILVIALIVLPLPMIGLPAISAPIALALGLLYAFIFENPCPKFNKKTSKYLLQVAVVCLGFNMNLHESERIRCEGMMFKV